MAQSKIVGIRIPDELLKEVESYGREYFPNEDGFNQTATILDLIAKGLTSVKQSVKHDDLESVKQNLLTHDEVSNIVKQLLNDALKPIQDRLDRLEQLPVESNLRQTEQGLTNAQLSELIKVPRSTIEKWKAKLMAGKPINSKNLESSNWKIGDDSLWHHSV